MEALFPIISPYEIKNYSLSNLSYHVIYSMEEKIKRYEENLKELSKKNLIYSIEIISLIIFFLCFLKLQLYLKEIE